MGDFLCLISQGINAVISIVYIFAGMVGRINKQKPLKEV
jgi:hypothetical protein